MGATVAVTSPPTPAPTHPSSLREDAGMKTRSLGQYSVSMVGLGCNNFGMRLDDQASADAVVHAALDAGVNYLDTADVYGDGVSETMLGAALGDRRDEVVVATKFGHRSARGDNGVGASRAFIRTSVEASRQRLGIDVIDHFQLHQPDDATPIAETLVALQELRDEGVIGATGCSNFSAQQLDDMAAAAEAEGVAPFTTVQNRYSVLTRTPEDDGVLDACARHGVGFVPYFPLESGLLTGKIRHGEPLPSGSRLEAWSEGDLGKMFLGDQMMTAAGRLTAYAEARGHTVLELAFSWLAAQPAVVSVIAGATRPEQVAANAAAADWVLTAEELAEIDAIVSA